MDSDNEEEEDEDDGTKPRVEGEVRTKDRKERNRIHAKLTRGSNTSPSAFPLLCISLHPLTIPHILPFSMFPPPSILPQIARNSSHPTCKN